MSDSRVNSALRQELERIAPDQAGPKTKRQMPTLPVLSLAGISSTMNEGILIEPLIDRDQLCIVLNMEPWVINQMRRDGVIPSVSFGPRRHRYRLSDVLKALARRAK